MTRKLMTLVIAALATAIAGAAWPTNGVVVNTEGKPVPRARVYAFLGETLNSRKILIHADGKGRFSFKPPGPGRYYYLADAKGYGFAMACDRRINPGKITLKLWREGSLPGQVLDPSGKPVTGATVGIHAFDAWDDPTDAAKLAKPWIWFRDQPTFVGSVKTDKHGKFVIGRLPDLSKFKTVRLRLDVTAPGRAPSFRFFNKREVASRLTMVSSPACTLAGTVYLPDKSGVAPQTLGVIASYSLPGAALAQSYVYLDKNGRFEFKDLPQGPVTISIGGKILTYDESTDQPVLDPSTEWILPTMPTLALVPGEAGNVEIVLGRGAMVKGKVIDKATGKPVTGGYLQVIRAGLPARQPRQVPIERDGQFTVRAAPGTFNISVEYCLVDGRYVSVRDSEDLGAQAPSQEFTLAGGEEKSDVVFEVDSETSERSYLYFGPAQPLPADFQLKPGTYRLTWDRNAPSSESPYSSGPFNNEQAKAKMTKLPELKSKKPIYGCVPVDGLANPACYIFDQSTGTGVGYDTLYVDANRNGDLTDDQPVTWRSTSSYGFTPWVEVQAHQGTGDDQTSNPIKVRWQMNNRLPMGMLRKGAWTGTIDTSNGSAKVILADYNGNGVYNDGRKSSSGGLISSLRGDPIAFRAGAKEPMYSDSWQPLVQGGPSVVGSKAYVFTADASGSELTIKPYTGPMGKFLVRKINLGGHQGRLASISISGANGGMQYTDVAAKAITLPAGNYTINWVDLTLGNGRNMLQITGSMNRPVHVKPNSQAVLDIVGKPRLRIMANNSALVLKPGAEQRIAWSYDFGDVLKSASIYTMGASNTAVAKARFDTSRKSIAVYNKPGGG